MANQRFYSDLRTLQKRANQRLVRLEQMDSKSPAYRAVQAQLELLGKETKGERGRRFSETGKATYNEYEHQMRVLKAFLGQKTSTTGGAKQYYKDVYETADERYGLTAKGISKDEWLDFWEAQAADKKDRMFYSQSVKIFETVIRKQNENRAEARRLYNAGKISADDYEEIMENEMTAKEIGEALQASKTMSSVYDKLDISWEDLKKTERLKKQEKKENDLNGFVR